VLGGLLAICSAATFAFNNASVRRGVLTGSVAQAMAITVPIGVPLFFLAALLTGRLGDVLSFSTQGYVALALAGILHFVWGATATIAPRAPSAPTWSRRSSSSTCLSP